MQKSPASPSGRILRTATLLAVAVAALLLLEISLRRFEPRSSINNDLFQVLEPHPTRLWTLKDEEMLRRSFLPGETGDGGPENPGDGGPAGTGRTVVVTGDSTVYGHGVSAQESFAWQLGKLLGNGTTVWNLGVPAYTTFQSIRRLQAHLDAHPDLDLLVVANVWSDAVFDEFVDSEVLRRVDSDLAQTLFAINRTLARTAVWRALLRAAGKAEPRQVLWNLRQQKTSRGRRRVSADEYADNLGRLVRTARERDADVVFLLFGGQLEIVEPNRTWHWQPYKTVMRQVAHRLGVPLVDMQQLFADSGLDAAALFMDHVHPSAAGHRIIAEALARRLADDGWLTGAPLRTPTPAPATPRYVDPLVQPFATPLFPGYSLAGVIRPKRTTESMAQGQAGAAAGSDVLVRLEVVDADSPEQRVVDSDTLPAGSPFVFTVPEDRRYRLRAALQPSSGGPAAAPSVPLAEAVFDLRNAQAWGIAIDVDQGYLFAAPPVPEPWQRFLDSLQH
jgi:lysophospholipase L1-like esterase